MGLARQTWVRRGKRCNRDWPCHPDRRGPDKQQQSVVELAVNKTDGGQDVYQPRLRSPNQKRILTSTSRQPVGETSSCLCWLIGEQSCSESDSRSDAEKPNIDNSEHIGSGETLVSRCAVQRAQR